MPLLTSAHRLCPDFPWMKYSIPISSVKSVIFFDFLVDIGPWNPHVTCHQGSLAAVASNTPPANSTRTLRPPPMAELSGSLGNCGKRHGNKGYYGWVVWGAKCRKDRNGCFTTFLDLILGCWKWDVQEIWSCQNENLLSWLVKTMWNIGMVASWLKQQATIVD